jgi:hypothetical protein
MYYFISSFQPGIIHGGNNSDGTEAGIFLMCYHLTGLNGSSDGFRMCLAF